MEELIKTIKSVFEGIVAIIKDIRRPKDLDPEFIAKHKVAADKEHLLCIGGLAIGANNPNGSELILDNDRERKDYYLPLWDITDSKSAKEVLDDFLVHDRDMTKTQSQLAQGYEKLFKYLEKDAVKKNLPNPLSLEKIQSVTDLTAFNLERGGYLARLCFISNYISEEECYNYLKQHLEVAKKLYKSWDDYVVAYILGDAYNFDDDTISSVISGLSAGTYLKLINNPDFYYAKYPLN